MQSSSDKIRLLMVDDENDFLESTAAALSRRGFEITTAANGVEALLLISQIELDIVLLDVKMPGMDGVEVLQRIKAEHPNLPVIILTGHGNVADAFKSSKLGVVDFLSKPYDTDYLASKIREIVKKSSVVPPPAEKPAEPLLPLDIKVLLVDDEEELLSSLAPALRRRGFTVETAVSGDVALKKAAQRDYDVIVLDVKMPGIDGVETLKKLKETGKTFEVLMLTGHPNVTSAFESVKTGAAEYFTKPPDVDELSAAIRKLYDKKVLATARAGQDIAKDILEKYPE